MTEALSAKVVVVGGGPAGIAAAVSAAEAGADTLLLDEAQAPGGQIWRAGVKGPPSVAMDWVDRLQRSGARVMARAAVFDRAGERALAVERDGEAIAVGYEHLILATGARELFLPFPGWTLPEVMGIGGAQALVKAGASVAGRRVVIAGSGPLILPVAATLAKAGARLVMVAEQAPGAAVRKFALGLWRQPGKIAEAAGLRMSFAATRYRTGTWVTAAEGDERVERVTVTDGNRQREIACDLLATSYGLVPNLELPQFLGCRVEAFVVAVDVEQRSSVEGVFAAGEICGIGGVDLALVEGRIAGLAAAGVEVPADLQARRTGLRRFAGSLATAFRPHSELFDRLEDDTTVCRCEDVPWSEIDPAWSMRQSKLYLRTGMGACQGRICGPALGMLCGWKPDTVRPPLKPVSASTLAELGSAEE